MNSLAQLTDNSLHSETKRLVGSSNTLTAQLLAHLGEVEARGIPRERACSSLYTYCVYELCMSEDEAQRRCRAARLARQFPILLEMLAEASLHLTGILLLGPHLTDANCAELLARARFRTKREIERLVAEIAPCPDVPSRIVPLQRAGAEYWMVSPLDDDLHGPVAQPHNTWAAYVRALAGDVRQLEAGLGAGQAPPRASEEEIAAAARGQAFGDAAQDGEAGVRTPALDERQEARYHVSTAAASVPARPAASGTPTAEVRYRVQFTADQAFVDLLEEARNLLQHELPTRDLVAVQRRALELLVHKLRQRKYAASEHPRSKVTGPVHGAPHPQSTSARPAAPPPVTHALHPAPRSHAACRAGVGGVGHHGGSDTRSERAAPPPEPESKSKSKSEQRVTTAEATHARKGLPPAPKSKSKSEQWVSATEATGAPRSAPQSANQGRYIPAEVRRSVWKRDEARCTYVDDRGQRCREQSGLEFHHRHPHARRGAASIDNLALRCRSHNALAAEQDFGRDVIREKQARRATLTEPDRAGAAP